MQPDLIESFGRELAQVVAQSYALAVPFALALLAWLRWGDRVVQDVVRARRCDGP